MSGSPEVVQIPAPRTTVSANDALATKRERGDAAGRRASGLSKVAWLPPSELGPAEWLSTGRRLGAIGRCSQWWIGDWIRYGTSRWGEKYVEAARVTGYDVASLRNMAWVAAQFDLSLRSDKLSWSHHVLLAPLEREQQQRWIARAVEEGLSVADLRLELRARGNGGGKGQEAAGDGSPEQGEGICPHCGHKLSKSAD
jgi:hypothetical protein